MNFSDRLHTAIAVLFNADNDPAPRNVRTLPRRRLESADVEDFMQAADHRDVPLFTEMDNLLTDLARTYPLRARKLKREIRWMRHQAYKLDIGWGRKKRWHE